MPIHKWSKKTIASALSNLGTLTKDSKNNHHSDDDDEDFFRNPEYSNDSSVSVDPQLLAISIKISSMPPVAAAPQHHHSTGGGLRMEDTALATRWSPPEKDMEGHASNILWAAVCRDDVLLTEVSADESVKIPYAGRRMLRKEAKTGFDFYTYTISSKGQNRRFVRGVKFHVYERLPLPIGARARLDGLEFQTFLNGQTVRIIEYDANTNKYMIRPTVPLPEHQKLSTTGKLIVKASHLTPVQPQDNTWRVWTFACLYDNDRVQQKTACLFIEKIVMIAEAFRGTDEWKTGKDLSCQELFAPILQAQMEHFQNENDATEFLDDSMEFTKTIVQRNVEIANTSTPVSI